MATMGLLEPAAPVKVAIAGAEVEGVTTGVGLTTGVDGGGTGLYGGGAGAEEVGLGGAGLETTGGGGAGLE